MAPHVTHRYTLRPEKQDALEGLIQELPEPVQSTKDRTLRGERINSHTIRKYFEGIDPEILKRRYGNRISSQTRTASKAPSQRRADPYAGQAKAYYDAFLLDFFVQENGTLEPAEPARQDEREWVSRRVWKVLVLYGFAVVLGVITLLALRLLFAIDHPGMLAAAGLGPLLLVFLLKTVPDWIDRRGAGQPIEITVNSAPHDRSYFRLDPYSGSPDDQKRYGRADGAHQDICGWIRDSKKPLLFLTGLSGSGKSSCLHAFVQPQLEHPPDGARPFCVVVVRGREDPLQELCKVINENPRIWARMPASIPDEPISLLERAHRRLQDTPLLIVFDQFEEFLLLPEDEAQRQDRFRQFLVTLLREPVEALQLLFVLRIEYWNTLISSLLPDGTLPESNASPIDFKILDPFSAADARSFLSEGVQQAGLRLDNVLLDRIIDQLAEEEGTIGFIRPVHVNMMGLVLTQLSPQKLKALDGPEVWIPDVITDYLSYQIYKSGLPEVAPALLRHMLTRAGTKRMCRLDELAGKINTTVDAVRSCLMLLQDKNLVRALDRKGLTWEIPHDFLAHHISQVLVTWRMPLRRRMRPYLAHLALGLWLLLLMGNYPLSSVYKSVQQERLIDRIALLGGSFSPITPGQGKLAIRFWADTDTEETLPVLKALSRDHNIVLGLPFSGSTDSTVVARSSENLEKYGAAFLTRTLDPTRFETNLSLFGSSIEALPDLRGLPRVTTLDVRNTRIRALPELEYLGSLRQLNIRGTAIAALPHLGNLTDLNLLNLRGTPISALPGLDRLTRLKQLDAFDTSIRELPDLSKLTALVNLDLSYTDITAVPGLEKLTSLSLLDLSGTNIAALPGLDKLESLLELNLSETRVVSLPDLSNLTALITLRLRGTAIEELPGIENLDALTKLDIRDTRIPPAYVEALRERLPHCDIYYP